VVSRFAPAPTGHLHLGHVVNALHVWGITREAGGRVLLRIEDHDRQRSRREYERSILDDLDWLGLVPDQPSTDAFRAGSCRGRQSNRRDVYERAFERLRAAGVLYACDCTRRRLRGTGTPPGQGAGGGLQSDDSERSCHSGRCRGRQLPFGDDVGIRVRLDPSVERFDDLARGPQEQRPFEQCGDMLIRDRYGNWTYQFAVTADDFDQGVNLIIRGDDLLASTGRQIQLARLIGRAEPPRFLHHGLIMKSATQKLSKADRDTSVREMRTSGLSAGEVIGRALRAAGFTGAEEPIAREEAQRIIAGRYHARGREMSTHAGAHDEGRCHR
jgi:glutamyl-tRNA synthetase/glutamyl-Q tRNA(Asp) synthetase